MIVLLLLGFVSGAMVGTGVVLVYGARCACYVETAWDCPRHGERAWERDKRRRRS